MANESTDTAQTPADASSSGTSAAAATTPVTPTIDLNQVLADNRRLQGERDNALAQNREVRGWSTRLSQQNAELNRRLQERGEVSFDEPQTRTSSYNEELAAEIAEVKFKQDHADWNKQVSKDSPKTVWDEMKTILFDDNQASEFAGRTPYLTLKNVYKEIELRRLRAQVKATPSGAADARRAQLIAQAEMSGQGANVPLPTIDISDPNMTEAQFLEAADKAGLLDELVDPNDPPSFMRK